MDKRKMILKICKWVIENKLYNPEDFLPYQEIMQTKLSNPEINNNDYNQIINQLINILCVKTLIVDLGLIDFETNSGKISKDLFKWKVWNV